MRRKDNIFDRQVTRSKFPLRLPYFLYEDICSPYNDFVASEHEDFLPTIMHFKKIWDQFIVEREKWKLNPKKNELPFWNN